MAGMISPVESKRLAALRFPLIALVIYIHARAGTVTFGDKAVSLQSGLVDAIKSAISDGIARTAVPLFFLLSGFLLFHGQRHWSWTKFSAKLGRRFQTLVVPYLFWNLLLYLVLAVAQFTSLKVFFSSSGLLSDMAWGQQARWVLGLQRYPIAYQFWFIRDLILLVLMAPAFFLLAQRRTVAIVIVGILGLCWTADWWPINVPAIEAVLFFFIGVAAGVRAKDLFVGPPLLPLVVVYAGLLACFLLSRGSGIESYVQHTLVATGIFVALGMVRNLPPLALDRIAALAGASFFVFAVHEPLTTTLLKVGYRVLPISSAMALAIYLFVPVLVIAITLILYRVAMAIAPEVTRRVTGR